MHIQVPVSVDVQDSRYGVGIGIPAQGRRGLRDAAESPTPAPLKAEPNPLLIVVPVALCIILSIIFCICCCLLRRRYEGSGLILADQEQTELTFSLPEEQGKGKVGTLKQMDGRR